MGHGVVAYVTRQGTVGHGVMGSPPGLCGSSIVYAQICRFEVIQRGLCLCVAIYGHIQCMTAAVNHYMCSLCTLILVSLGANIRFVHTNIVYSVCKPVIHVCGPRSGLFDLNHLI